MKGLRSAENSSAGVKQEGFTLLELLISMFLVLLVTLVTTGAMRMGYRSVSWGDGKIDFQEHFRAALPIIETQIQSALPVGSFPAGSELQGGRAGDTQRMYFKGDQNEMRFATNFSIWDGRQGYLLVSYRIVQEAGGKKSLYVSENTLGMQARRETLLLGSIDELSFDYFSANALESGFWVSEWKEAAAFPEKVRIQIFCRGKDFTMVVATRVKRNLVRTAAAADNTVSNAG